MVLRDKTASPLGGRHGPTPNTTTIPETMDKGLEYSAFILYLCAGVFIGLAHWALNPDPSIPWSILTGAVGFLMVLLIHDSFARSAHERDLIRMVNQFSHDHQAILSKITHIESQLTAPDDNSPMAQSLKAERRVVGALMEKLSHYEKSVPHDAPKKVGEKNITPPQTGVGGLDTDILSELKKAISQDRVEMLVQPIVSLPQRKTRHFECFSRLRTDDNRLILPDDFLKMAAGQSLIRLIDNTLLFKCAALTRRLLMKKFNVLFFCNISHETLMDGDFLDGFIDFIHGNKPLIPNLVFELDDENLKCHGDQIFPILGKLAGYGCYFSLDVTTFDHLDIDVLARHHFKFIKIAAKMILQNPHAPLIKKIADQNAIDIILTQVEDEQTLIQCQDLHFDFGQGYLFGKPRPMVL